MYPSITQAQVISQDPVTGGLNVAFPSGQMASYPVRFGHHGPADAMRINHPALPGRGTWGVVLFPGGDSRAGVWVCSLYTSFIDARTTDSDPFLEYNSHWSGYYDLLNQNGDIAVSFPDGTFLVVSGAAVKPETFRHVADVKQDRQTIAFTDAQRVPNPPSPKNVYLQTAGGDSVLFDPSGNITVNLPVSATCTINIGSSATSIMMSNGTIDITAADTINLGSLGETLYRLVDERMVTLFNNHEHSGVQTGGGISGKSTTTMSVGTQTTTITKAG